MLKHNTRFYITKVSIKKSLSHTVVTGSIALIWIKNLCVEIKYWPVNWLAEDHNTNCLKTVAKRLVQSADFIR